MEYLEVEIETWSRGILIPYRGETKRLYDKWVESQHDEDFEEFADWAAEDVKDEIEFYITDAKVRR